MCGIVGYIGEKCNLKDILIQDLKTLEYRGYDSSGIAIYNGNINIVKSKGKIINLEKRLKNLTIQEGTIGLAHTRWATHGEANDINSHPHQVGKVTIVHNGIIENEGELKNILINEGYHFISDTDTEVIAALLDNIYRQEIDPFKSIQKMQNQLMGSYALGIIFEDDCQHLYAVKKDSPLIVGVKKGCNMIASDVTAIANHMKEYLVIEDYEIVQLSSENVEVFARNLIKKNKEILNIFWDIDNSSKNTYSHFMLKEIHDEPSCLHETIKDYVYSVDDLIKNMPNFERYQMIHIVGCGSAMHAGLVAKKVIEKYADMPVIVYLSSEYRYQKNFYDKNTLVIFVSQSGETADTIAALRNVKKDAIGTLAIVNVVGSTLAREANYVLYIKAGVEVAVATTKAYTLQVAMLILIGLNLAYIRKKIDSERLKQILNEFQLIPSKIAAILKQDDMCLRFAKRFYRTYNVFFLGRGIDYASSMEGSLKLKEVSYIHSEAYPAGELKHGTLSLIENETIIIGILSDKDLAIKTLNNIKETISRGAKVLLIITDDLVDQVDFDCHKFVVAKTIDALQPLLIAVPLQLIAFHVAKLRGCDIDKPRNLAKSVTVE